METEVGETLADGTDKGKAGGEAIQQQVTAELNTTGTTQNGLLHAEEGTATDFEKGKTLPPPSF